MLSNRELLEIEFDTLWMKDDRGRIAASGGRGRRAVPYLAIGVANDGFVLAFGDDVADSLASEIEGYFAEEAPPADVSSSPMALARSEALLSRVVGPVEPRDGPTYVIPRGSKFDSDSTILPSAAQSSEVLRNQDYKRIGWTEDEWRQLLDGELGPWAFVVDGYRVVSICHSARLTDRGAEAGTWTDPAFRGRGLAAAATAAWAELLAPSGRTLFYSTWSGNVSSRRVAERLGLPLIGWTWSLSSQEPEAITT